MQQTYVKTGVGQLIEPRNIMAFIEHVKAVRLTRNFLLFRACVNHANQLPYLIFRECSV
jgi:hypothetical protein